MLKEDKERKIISIVEEITGKKIELDQKPFKDANKKFRNFRIKKILLISSTFNYFLLEEEGRLTSLFSDYYTYDKKEPLPDIVHVESCQEALNHIDREYYDLILIFNKPQGTSISEIAKKIDEKTKTPVVVIGNDLKELISISNKKTNITNFFTWNGDGKILLSIIQGMEDGKNLQETSLGDPIKCILLIEDSIQHYSTYLTLITEEINRYLEETIKKDIGDEQKSLRYKGRPFVIHTNDFSKGEEIYEKYKDNLICIISDNYEQKNGKRIPVGILFAEKINAKKHKLPIVIQSSEPFETDESTNKNFKYISKNSPSLIKDIRSFIRESFGFQKVILKDKNGIEISHINTLDDFEQALSKVDAKVLLKYAKKEVFSKWLKDIGEIALSKKIHQVELDCSDEKILKNQLFDILEDYSYSIDQAAIASFSRVSNNPLVKINRIGEGALGGKARGIAFIAKLLSKYMDEDLFPGLDITIPRSIVLSTDVFDDFLDKNNFFGLDFLKSSDDRISTKFMESNLPATILGDLRSFIRDSRKPLIVRSSGLLEDSLMQPFAGIYASVLLPNESWETDLRFQEVCNAIKYVYSSTFFERSQTYIKSTPKNMGDEKMAVLIQEVIGTRHENYFYPTISGVAKSYNYYPSGPCKPEDGIVYLALGLGKAIVDGGQSFAFCPESPKTPLFGTQKDYMKHAQSQFYALNLRSIYRFVDFSEETSLDKIEIDIAKKHGCLDRIASTYVQEDDRLYPGLYDGGYTIIDFAPIINYDDIPVAKAIKLLLKISEIALGYPVEIEFAVNISKDASKKTELIILQIRNMIPPHKKLDIDIDKIPKNDTILYTENSLGHGIVKELSDIIYVDQEKFDLSNSSRVVNEIKEFNKELMKQNKPYVLIGPGRWGSSDPWLGIPVIWSDIAGAKIIIEVPYKERHIDPSQGSHFFHDMIASQVGYLISKKQEDFDKKWLEKQKIVKQTEFVKHIKTRKPIEAIIDGKKGKAVLIHKKVENEKR